MQSKAAESGEKKPKTVEEVQKKSKSGFVNADQVRKTELIDDYDKDFYEDAEEGAQYLYMELKSLTSTSAINIDALLESTTLDSFMHGLYTANKIGVERSEKKLNVLDLLN